MDACLDSERSLSICGVVNERSKIRKVHGPPPCVMKKSAPVTLPLISTSTNNSIRNGLPYT